MKADTIAAPHPFDHLRSRLFTKGDHIMPPSSIRGKGARGGSRFGGRGTLSVRTLPVLELSTSRVLTRLSPALTPTFGISTRLSAHGVVQHSTSIHGSLLSPSRVSTRSTLAPTLPPAFTSTPTPRSIIPTTGVLTRSTIQTIIPSAHDSTDSHSISDSAHTSSQALPSATPNLFSGTSLSSKVRGITRGKGTLNVVRSFGKLKVDFDFKSRKAVGPNSSRFNNECGYIYQHKGSFSYTEWRKVPEAVRFPLREDLLESFDLDLDDPEVCRIINTQFAKAWRNVKTTFHEHFNKIGGKVDPEAAKRNPHPLLRNRISDWIFLCDVYNDPKYQLKEKNVTSSSKRKWAPKNGSVLTPAHHVSRGALLDGHVGHIETFRRQYYCETTGWLEPDLVEKYVEMMSLRSQHDPKVMPDVDILEMVLGRQFTRLIGWDIYSATSIDTESIVGQSDQIFQDVVSLREELVAAKCQISQMELEMRELRDELVARGVLPPLPVLSQVPDQGSTTIA